MAPQALLVFEHATLLGNAPAHKLFERVKNTAKPGVTAARSFADYVLVIDDANLPAGIKLHRKL
jgi:CRISPR-associated protein Csd2